MKWSELPQEYRDLEKGFVNNADINELYDTISIRFYWDCTPQGKEFWDKCDIAQSIQELPPIPIISDLPPIPKTPIEQLLETISCANCVFNVNSKCKAIGIAIEIHREDSFFCSDHRNVNQLN